MDFRHFNALKYFYIYTVIIQMSIVTSYRIIEQVKSGYIAFNVQFTWHQTYLGKMFQYEMSF